MSIFRNTKSHLPKRLGYVKTQNLMIYEIIRDHVEYEYKQERN